MIKDLILIISGATVCCAFYFWKDYKDKEEINNDVTILFKVVDKLEQRISTLEKVLASHAKCIGEMREIKND